MTQAVSTRALRLITLAGRFSVLPSWSASSAVNSCIPLQSSICAYLYLQQTTFNLASDTPRSLPSHVIITVLQEVFSALSPAPADPISNLPAHLQVRHAINTQPQLHRHNNISRNVRKHPRINPHLPRPPLLAPPQTRPRHIPHQPTSQQTRRTLRKPRQRNPAASLQNRLPPRAPRNRRQRPRFVSRSRQRRIPRLQGEQTARV